jgi:hypothetical protein
MNLGLALVIYKLKVRLIKPKEIFSFSSHFYQSFFQVCKFDAAACSGIAVSTDIGSSCRSSPTRKQQQEKLANDRTKMRHRSLSALPAKTSGEETSTTAQESIITSTTTDDTATTTTAGTEEETQSEFSGECQIKWKTFDFQSFRFLSAKH